jgi:hypothetical protein
MENVARDDASAAIILWANPPASLEDWQATACRLARSA